ncbi:MAG: DUF3641 domain-containing protein [Verrucomicrobia bacterium]|nr:DUF3641 domain-containing protein [Verrucomicrobiota bacterium]
MNTFDSTLAAHGRRLRRTRPRVLQINVGQLCNLSCIHCHVNAGPARKEIMSRETVERILVWQRRARLPVVDLTGGARLPPPQAELEADYKRELRTHFGIEFNQLYTITNLPVSRFAAWLRHQGHYEAYMALLVSAFNPATVEGPMCRDTINVSWLGEVFDCDFNQMMKLPMGGARGPRHLWDIDPAMLEGTPIAVGSHCFGCTAGAGSSCGGALTTAGGDVRQADVAAA